MNDIKVNETELQTRLKKVLSGEALLAKAEGLANFGSWQAGILNGKAEWSGEMYRIYGYEPGSFEPSVEIFFNHVHPDDVSTVRSSFNETADKPDFKGIDYRIIDKNGLVKYIHSLFLVYQNSKGEITEITGLSRDDSKSKMLEGHLKETQANYEAIVKNSMSAFFLYNNKGEILETNDAASEMFGYTNDELTHLTRRQILEDEDPKFVIALQHLEKKGRMKGEVLGIKKNRDRILIEFTATQFVDAKKEEKFILSMVDITSRKQQEEILLKSNERFEQVSKATFDAIWDWDIKSKQLYFGDGFKELFGYHIQNNTGDFATWCSHIHPEDRENIILSRLNKIIHHTESTWKDEYRYIRANGTIAYISDRGILLRNSMRTYRMIGAMQDVTELKENEIAISNLNRSLEKRAQELAISNEELERFAYVASHDLQEPLRMVSSFLQLLQKKYNHQLDEMAQKYIYYAVDGADRMKTLILELLEYSRISSDKQNHSILNLNEVMHKTMQVLKPLIDEAQATVIVAGLPEIYGNSSQLQRLFQNLISNALKYRIALNPMVEIGCTDTGNEWQFFVKDNGIGIEPKYFEKIFIIFQRLHSRAEYTGTGIGLAICKKIVELHKGRIWVKSSLDAGSTFYFTIAKMQMKNAAVTEKGEAV